MSERAALAVGAVVLGAWYFGWMTTAVVMYLTGHPWLFFGAFVLGLAGAHALVKPAAHLSVALLPRLPHEPRWWQRCWCCRRSAEYRDLLGNTWCMPCKFGGDRHDLRCNCWKTS